MHSISYFEGGGVRHTHDFKIRLPERGKRKAIKGFSVKSRRRLRTFLLENEVPNTTAIAGTLTVSIVESPEQWRKRWKKFRGWLYDRGIPCVWRVELQRRGVPHLHCIFFVGHGSPETYSEQIKSYWLKLWGVQNDLDHIEHSCKFRYEIDGGWFGYLVLHSAKHKQDQIGWEGRQWGVVLKDRFENRENVSWKLDAFQYDYFRCLLNKLLRYRGRKKPLPICGAWDCLGLDKFTVEECFRRTVNHSLKNVPF